MDPHAQNHQTTHAFLQQVISARATPSYQLAAATQWTQVSPTQVRFAAQGRQVPRWRAVTADDVVFSLTRRGDTAVQHDVAAEASGSQKVDDFTVDLIIKARTPILLRELTEARIMNRAWAEKPTSATQVAGLRRQEENCASRNANGTGPFCHGKLAPDVKVAPEEPELVGQAPWQHRRRCSPPLVSRHAPGPPGISGQVDFVVVDPPPRDLARMKANADLKLVEAPRTTISWPGPVPRRTARRWHACKKPAQR